MLNSFYYHHNAEPPADPIKSAAELAVCLGCERSNKFIGEHLQYICFEKNEWR